MAKPVTFALKPFERCPSSGQQRSVLASELAMDVTVFREGPMLSLLYRLTGVNKVVVPSAVQKPGRRDRLWERTCFEFFLSEQRVPTKESPYWEFNLSPTGDWNVFFLQPYRHRLKQESALTGLPITVQTSSTTLRLATSVDLSGLIDPLKPLRLGSSAVIVLREEEALRESFWSITHPDLQPDFHHPDSFAVELMP